MNDVARQLEQVWKAQGKSVLGAMVYWSLGGVHWERDTMRAQWEALGLGAAIGRDPRPEALLSEAVGKALAGTKALLCRRLSRFSWAIVEELNAKAEDTKAAKLAHKHVITLAVGADPGLPGVLTWELVESAAAVKSFELLDKIKAAYADLREYACTSDLSTALVEALQGTMRNPMLSAISLRETAGGLYFVPASQVERMQQLADLVREHTGSRVNVLKLYADESNLATAAEAASASFTAQLNELRGELKAFVAERKAEGAEMTENHLETRVKRLQALGARVDVWADILGDVAGDLRKTIEVAKVEVATEMGL